MTECRKCQQIKMYTRNYSCLCQQQPIAQSDAHQHMNHQHGAGGTEAGSHDAQSSECTMPCLQRALRSPIMFAVMAKHTASLWLHASESTESKKNKHYSTTTTKQAGRQSLNAFNSRSQCHKGKPDCPHSCSSPSMPQKHVRKEHGR